MKMRTPRIYSKRQWWQNPEFDEIGQRYWVELTEISGHGSVGITIERDGTVLPTIELDGTDFWLDEIL